MKIKNLAFCGVMASILGVGAASADTVIASKAYVDAQTAPKQLTSNIETATYALSENKTSTTKYPSMATLKDAYDTLDTAISTASTAIGTNAATTNVLALTGDDVHKLTKAEAIQAAAQAAQTLDTEQGQTIADVTKWTSANTYDTKFPTQKAVAQQMEKLDSEAWTNNALDTTQQGYSNAKLMKVESLQDTTSTTASATYTAGQTTGSSTIATATANTDGNTDTKLATTGAVADTASAIINYVEDKVAGASAGSTAAIQALDTNPDEDGNGTAITTAGQAIVSVTQSNGQVSASSGTITYQEGLVNTLKSINNATADASCSTSDPCMLTYIGTSTNGTPQFRWTNLATENLTADTTTAGV